MYTIPKTFLHVIKKMTPEILDVNVINCEFIQKISPVSLAPIECYLVVVELIISDYNKLNGDNKVYEEQLNTQFTYIYGELDFIRFSVRNLQIKERPTNREIFMSLFVNND